MELLDFEERWVYRGSSTTPPCESGYLWNVLATVYPIREDTLKKFKAAQAVASTWYGEGTYDGEDGSLDKIGGNYRSPFTAVTEHNIKYVRKTPGPGNDDEGFGPAVIFLGILCTILVGITLYCTLKYNKREGEKFAAARAAEKAEGQ